ncbi:MAG TPA: inositol monophosphatase [Acidimicrobiales bacterium]|nr:inositol monophosphatase [Acidimicrobiales bacterium]
MNDEDLLEVLSTTAGAVRSALDGVDDWRPTTGRPGQYAIDVVADEVAVDALLATGLGVLSEESGGHHLDREVVVVLDPVDGSTNASRGVPWYATSLCAVDRDGPRVALVVNQASGERFEAMRGRGARCGERSVTPSGCDELGRALLGFSGRPLRRWGWGQFRSLGAAALDLCCVASGRFDGYVDSSPGGHSPWDYLGALLVCREAGVEVVDAEGRELVTLDHAARRTPVAAATPALLAELLSLAGDGDHGE